MANLKRDIKSEPVSDKVLDGKELVTKCTGNTNIGTVTTALDAFETANDGLEQAQMDVDNARTAAEQLQTVLETKEEEWNTKLETLLTLIESNTEGDRTKLETTGLEVSAQGRNTPVAPVQVTGLAVTMGDNPGELEPSWDGQKPRPRLFLVRMCPGPYVQANMVVVGTPSGSRFLKTGLTSGTEYWFEVAAVGSGNQQGPWSDPAKGRAP